MQLFFLVPLLIILSIASPASADIYKYEDAQGVIHLTNVPTESGVKYVLIMREKRILLDRKLGDNIYRNMMT